MTYRRPRPENLSSPFAILAFSRDGDAVPDDVDEIPVEGLIAMEEDPETTDSVLGDPVEEEITQSTAPVRSEEEREDTDGWEPIVT